MVVIGRAFYPATLLTSLAHSPFVPQRNPAYCYHDNSSSFFLFYFLVGGILLELEFFLHVLVNASTTEV